MVVTICIELKLKLDSLDWNRFVIVDGCGGGRGRGGWMCDDKNKRTKEGREGTKHYNGGEGKRKCHSKEKRKEYKPLYYYKERKKEEKETARTISIPRSKERVL